MSLRFHEISEQRHRILNPFTDAQLELLGEICQIHNGMHQLDLCCGKGEMLCTWLARYGLQGLGVDISPVFLVLTPASMSLGCSQRVSFIEADAGSYPIPEAAFDIMSCIRRNLDRWSATARLI